ncbi:MAG: ABC transporter substrate-binding protein [Proteobacteria bacterium]|nr:ABC transporter substrate-binding protein [Pseudomonadota bacterium]
MKTLAALLFALLLPLSVQAEEQTPEGLVRQVTDDVLAAIKSDKALQAGDKQKALALAEQKVLPHVDFPEMTRLASGRTWNLATGEQRERMVAAFRAMLVRTYANAIDVYRGQTMKIVSAKVPADATDATVRNRYLSPGKEATPVDYSMHKTPDGWKIYDIAVDGVSLVLTYRSQFNEAAQSGGVEGLIRQLQDKTKAQPAVRAG